MPADLTMTIDDAANALARATEEACVRIRNVAQELTFRMEQAAEARAAQGDRPIVDVEGADAVIVHELDQLAAFDAVTLNLSGIMHFLHTARQLPSGRYKIAIALRKIRPAER